MLAVIIVYGALALAVVVCSVWLIGKGK